MPQREANEKGYQQVLWLYEDKLTEVGTMNFFLYWINDESAFLTPLCHSLLSR